MKKNLLTILTLLFILYFIFTHNILIKDNILNSLNLFINNIFISLFPIMIISKLLINYNLPYYIANFFKSNYIYIYLTSLISGSPTNGIIINDLLNNKIITIEESNRYIMCTSFISPLFLYNMLSISFSKNKVLIIILISYISNLIIYLITYKKEKINIKKVEPLPFINALCNSIKSSFDSLLLILGMIIIFNIISLLLPNKLMFIKGLLEVSNGLNFINVANISLSMKEFLAIIYINFTGLCILLQIKSIINKNIYFSNLILSRFYSVVIGIILLYIIELLI